MTERAPEAILVVDDETATLNSVRRTLRSHGYQNVLTCADPTEVEGILETSDVALVLLDLIMPVMRGEDLLERIASRWPDLPVIVVTAEQDVTAAVRCMKLGAVDYLLKPVDADHLVAAISRTLEQGRLRWEASRLRERFFDVELDAPEIFREIITEDAGMQRMFAYLEAISRGSQPVLVTGETGSGKELVARALHDSGRAGRPFVAVNVAGLDDTMFSDTLFGHEPGAFTGAGERRSGMIERAADGTLFLDEIGDLSEASQVKLLRLLQEGEYYPLGSDSAKRLGARVVAATHVDPSRLRADLYYRLRAYRVKVPALRERLGDLPLLVRSFLEAAAADLGKAVPTPPAELPAYLRGYEFPGNVRELRSMVFEAVAHHDRGVLSIQPFLAWMDAQAGESVRPPSDDIVFPEPLPALRRIEGAAIDEALRRVEGNRSAAARLLGISRPTILRHIERTRDEPTDPE